MMMSAYMTISLTVERYISVVHPLLAIQLQSNYFCALLAAPGLVFSFLFTLPIYFLLECKHIDAESDILELFSNTSLHGSDLLSEATAPHVQLVWVPWRDNKAFTMVRIV